MIADAVKAKRNRVAVLDFTDSKGAVTPIGQFLAEELSTQILVAGELKVADHTVVDSTLKNSMSHSSNRLRLTRSSRLPRRCTPMYF